MALQNPAHRDRTAKASHINLCHFEPHDIQHVATKFGLSPDSVLAQRLGKANTKRRQLLAYHKYHVERISSHIDDAVDKHSEEDDLTKQTMQIGRIEARTIAKSISTKWTQNTTVSTIRPIEIDVTSESGRTRFSAATSTTGEQKETIRVPPPPRRRALAGTEEPSNSTAIFCPYCYQAVIFETIEDWKYHVYGDLRPYICTFGDCAKPNQLYDSYTEWAEHERQFHRREWFCNDCSSLFQTELLFLDHVEQFHKKDLTEVQKELISKLSERSISSPQKCPLCKKPPISSPIRFQQHLARHLQQLALFVLPSPDDEDVNEKEVDDGLARAQSTAGGSLESSLSLDFSEGSINDHLNPSRSDGPDESVPQGSEFQTEENREDIEGYVNSVDGQAHIANTAADIPSSQVQSYLQSESDKERRAIEELMGRGSSHRLTYADADTSTFINYGESVGETVSTGPRSDIPGAEALYNPFVQPSRRHSNTVYHDQHVSQAGSESHRSKKFKAPERYISDHEPRDESEYVSENEQSESGTPYYPFGGRRYGSNSNLDSRQGPRAASLDGPFSDLDDNEGSGRAEQSRVSRARERADIKSDRELRAFGESEEQRIEDREAIFRHRMPPAQVRKLAPKIHQDMTPMDPRPIGTQSATNPLSWASEPFVPDDDPEEHDRRQTKSFHGVNRGAQLAVANPRRQHREKAYRDERDYEYKGPLASEPFVLDYDPEQRNRRQMKSYYGPDHDAQIAMADSRRRRRGKAYVDERDYEYRRYSPDASSAKAVPDSQTHAKESESTTSGEASEAKPMTLVLDGMTLRFSSESGEGKSINIRTADEGDFDLNIGDGSSKSRRDKRTEDSSSDGVSYIANDDDSGRVRRKDPDNVRSDKPRRRDYTYTPYHR